MDSPSDLSPNAPPTGFEDSTAFFSHVQGIPPANDQKSADGSVDSSGYEKVDHDVLEEYGNQFANQMQQSIFGQLPEDPFKNEMSVPEEAGNTVKIDDVPLSTERDAADERSVHTDSLPFEHNDVDDLRSGLEESSQALVKEAVKKAEAVLTDDLLGSEQFVPEPPSHAAELIPTLNSTEISSHDVDDLVQFQESDQFPDIVSNLSSKPANDDHHHVDVPSLDDEPHFDSQTPEEVPYERSGPLTIPELSEKLESLIEPINDVPIPEPVNEPTHDHSFRIPTPPRVHIDTEQPSLNFHSPPSPPTPEPIIQHRSAAPVAPAAPPAPPVRTFTKSNGDAWFDFKSIDPKVLELIYWRDPKKSAVALSLVLIAIFVLGKYPILSVISYTGLAVLSATLGFRVFKAVEAQIKKTGGENPFQEYLAKDLTLPQERVHAQVDVLVEHASCLANQAKKVVFVESIVDSVKFGLLLWSLTYIASWFSGFALVVLAVLGVFSVPIFYETYKEPIDAQLAVISGHINNVSQLLEEKLPFLKKAEVAAKKDE